LHWKEHDGIFDGFVKDIISEFTDKKRLQLTTSAKILPTVG